jgi:hypothetical protein
VFPEQVIDRQVAGQPTVSFLGVLERHPVGPFPVEGLNESLGFAVGSGPVGPGPVTFRNGVTLGLPFRRPAQTVAALDY